MPGSTSGLVVSDIRLGNITSTGATGAYRGDLEVVFNSAQMVIARRPAKVIVAFQADVTNPAQAKITSCATAGSSGLSGGGGSGSGSSSGTDCTTQPNTAPGFPPNMATLPYPSGTIFKNSGGVCDTTATWLCQSNGTWAFIGVSAPSCPSSG